MAQMKARLLAIAFTLLASTSGWAQVSDSALSAEADGRWDDAIRLHRAAIDADPNRGDLWVRIADIEARRGNANESVAALQRAAAVSPGSKELYYRLSQAYSTVNQPKAALHAIEAALAVDANNADYLRARATLATWIADYDRARESYRRLVALRPDDLAAALAYARVSAWSGDTNEAVKQYRRYLKQHPETADAWIELARAEYWRGNFGQALEALAHYRTRFGETNTYTETYAAVMTGAGRPTRAVSALAPLLSEAPNDLRLNVTQAIASAMQHDARAAQSSLDTVRQLAPASQETRNAERQVRTMLSSSAEPAFTAYSDSDHLDVQRFSPRATFSLVSGTKLSAGYEQATLTAPNGTGLDQENGSTSAEYRQAWAGIGQKIGLLTLDAQAGYAEPGTHEVVTYRVAAAARASDSLLFSFQHSFDPLVISPRTVGLGLTQTGNRAQVQWAPTLQSVVTFDMQVQDFSDGNRRVEVLIAPHRSFARTAGFNLDLGMSAYRLETDRDLANGYYDPRRYEQYALTVFPYFKIKDNIGVSLSSALGAQRESPTASFAFGGTVGAEATFGIYEPWVLKFNGNVSMNQRLASGAFRGLSVGAVLIRRF